MRDCLNWDGLCTCLGGVTLIWLIEVERPARWLPSLGWGLELHRNRNPAEQTIIHPCSLIVETVWAAGSSSCSCCLSSPSGPEEMLLLVISLVMTFYPSNRKSQYKPLTMTHNIILISFYWQFCISKTSLWTLTPQTVTEIPVRCAMRKSRTQDLWD